ncbi:MAG: HEPN domain-containing protein [Candidatus Mariimomonas ferrooxydans]
MEIKVAFSYKDCIAKGLLRKIPASKDKASRSIRKSEKWLEEAEKTFKSGAFGSSVLASYLVMFHSARAILFFDGFREKSHACVARYFEEKYIKTGKLENKWLELLDYHREVRHNDQYSLSFFSTKDEAKVALESASQFLQRMKRLYTFLKKS